MNDERKKLRRKNIILLVICLAVIILAAVVLGGPFEKMLFRLVGMLLLLAVAALAFFGYYLVKKRQAQDMSAVSPEERIQQLEQELAQGKYHQSTLPITYLNLSAAYYDKGDLERAIQFNTQAEIEMSMIPASESAYHVTEMNKARFLIDQNRLDEAAAILNRLENSGVKNKAALISMWLHQGNLAARQKDPARARYHFGQLAGSKLQPGMKYHIMLLDAECDLLESNRTVAEPKLTEIIRDCTHLPTLRRAEELLQFG